MATRLTADALSRFCACHVAGARGRDQGAQPLRSRQLLFPKTNNGDRNHTARARDYSASMDVSWVADAWRPAHAWVGAWAASALYVGSLYLWPARYRAPRDHPAVIRRRTVSLLVTCVASCALPWVALQVAPPCAAVRAAGVALPATVAEATGLAAAGAAPAAIASLCLCALLFLGPLARAALDEGAASVARLFSQALAPKSATAWRNHVVAPVAEEWVFRAVCVPTLVFAGAATVAQAVTLAPLLFGSAHVHHFFETRERMVAAERRRNPERNRDAAERRATARALLAVSAQFAYTSLFGAFASFLVLRTGNACAPTAAHAFCNAFGAPDVLAAARSRHRTFVFAAYAVGIIAFAALLGPLTDPARHPGSRWDDLLAVSARSRDARR